MRYKFGSFNLHNLGMSAITKRDFERLADIIKGEGYDVIALQEILSEGYALENNIKHLLSGWDYRWAEPGESTDPTKNKDKRGEGFAFLWNTKRLALASCSTDRGMRTYEPRIINKGMRNPESAKFARAPLYARFVPVNGGFFEFRLINVHLHFGDNSVSEINKRKEEYDILVKEIYPNISQERRYGNNREAYTIVMGDYNLNLYKYRGEAESRINKNTYIEKQYETKTQTIKTVQDELTTLKSATTDESEDKNNPNRGYSQNYDHFTFDIKVFEREGMEYNCRRVDAVRKYYNDDFEEYRTNISDHVPISLELTINENL